jgi:hypothetical protein
MKIFVTLFPENFATNIFAKQHFKPLAAQPAHCTIPPFLLYTWKIINSFFRYPLEVNDLIMITTKIKPRHIFYSILFLLLIAVWSCASTNCPAYTHHSGKSHYKVSASSRR